MNNNNYYILCVIFFLIIIFILINIIQYKNHKELFENSNLFPNKECSNEFLTNSFCQYNTNDEKCECIYQKDEIKLGFYSSPGCCDNRVCSKLSKEECLKQTKRDEIPYYCNIGGKCIKNTGTILSRYISANNCGTDVLNNQILLPYASLEECEKRMDVCEKYNDPSKGRLENKENCLKDVNCGYCTNSQGLGKCISGNATSPSNLEKYYYCDANKKSGKNLYEYGNHAAYLLQPAPNIQQYNFS
jgi:hypothetical protein